MRKFRHPQHHIVNFFFATHDTRFENLLHWRSFAGAMHVSLRPFSRTRRPGRGFGQPSQCLAITAKRNRAFSPSKRCCNISNCAQHQQGNTASGEYDIFLPVTVTNTKNWPLIRSPAERPPVITDQIHQPRWWPFDGKGVSVTGAVRIRAIAGKPESTRCAAAFSMPENLAAGALDYSCALQPGA